MHRLVRSVVLSAAALAVAVPAASAQGPAPGFEEFAACPNDPSVFRCLNSVVDGGHLQMGNKDTPVTEPIVLKGGIESGTGNFVFNEQGGLFATPMRVPGGLVGLTGLPEVIIDLITLGANRVYATPELAGTPSNPLVNPFRLPLKVKLTNPFLSDTCYIGSDEDPIMLMLTARTTNPPPPNQPISGRNPTLGFDPNNSRIAVASNGLLVDNAFAAPAARGCDLTGLGVIDALVNAQVGLPSPAGTNTAEQEFGARFASRLNVYPTPAP
jgi:hypothetical protein